MYFTVGLQNWDRRGDVKVLHDSLHVLAIDKGGLKPNTNVALNIPLSGIRQFKDTVNTTHSNSLYFTVCTEESVSNPPGLI